MAAPLDEETEAEEKQEAKVESCVAPDQREDAITCIKNKQKNRLAASMKIVMKDTEAKKLSRAECFELIDAFISWMIKEKAEPSFNTIIKAFYNWIDKLEATGKALQIKIAQSGIQLTEIQRY